MTKGRKGGRENSLSLIMCIDAKYAFFPSQFRKHYKKRGKQSPVDDRYFPSPAKEL